ncbi:HEAT repeat-containing protein 7A-like [Carpediemonas membranifera]|uniref:HEAT repeat-containing protein 7A-like n=1 Tax=Carpediemonas membranifera TaxID=201153 RepID=A0A8J6B7Z3_9EUKA|nr:HEAT repeat-containing protein 7A-like [Carpediemonas membranifera]|eukprot:KAG9396139.1 HEAT repeat-containing protein 7A-like [Carpediemonas membranifera]
MEIHCDPKDVIANLLIQANDDDADVRATIRSVIVELAAKQADSIIEHAIEFIPMKLTTKHRVLIMDILASVSDAHHDKVSDSLANKAIEFAVNIVATNPREVNTDFSLAVSRFLLPFARSVPALLFASLTRHVSPQALPHYHILLSLSDLADANPKFIVQHAKTLLTQLLSVTGKVTKDQIRYAVSRLLGRLFNSIMTHGESAGVSPEMVGADAKAIFDLHIGDEARKLKGWLQLKDSLVRTEACLTIGSLAGLLDTITLSSHIENLIAIFMKLHAKEKNSAVVSLGLSRLMAAAEAAGVLPEALATNTVLALLPSVYAASEEDKRDASYVAAIIVHCAKAHLDSVLLLLLKQLDAASSQRPAVLAAIQALVLKMDEQLASKKELIVNGLEVVTLDTDILVRKAFVDLVDALAPRGYLEYGSGVALTRFLITQCSIADENIASYEEMMRKKRTTLPFSITDLRQHARETLAHAAADPALRKIFWPQLFAFIPNPRARAGLPTLCSALTAVAEAKLEDGEELYPQTVYMDMPKPTELLVPLLVAMRDPFGGDEGNLGARVMPLLRHLGPFIHEKLQTAFAEVMEQAEDALVPDVKPDVWRETVHSVLKRMIQMVGDDVWLVELGKAFLAALQQQHSNEYRAFVMEIIGVIVSCSQQKTFTTAALANVMNAVDDTVDVLGDAVAYAFGQAAPVHLDTTLVEIKKKYSSIDLSPKKKSKKKAQGPANEPIVRTIVLCLRSVLAAAQGGSLASYLDLHVIEKLIVFLEQEWPEEITVALLEAVYQLSEAAFPDRIKAQYTFSKRDTIVQLVMGIIVPGFPSPRAGAIASVPPAIRLEGIRAIRSLILHRKVDAETEQNLISCVLRFLNIPATQADAAVIAEEVQRIVISTLNLDPSPGTLIRVIGKVIPYLHGSNHPATRKYALGVINRLAKAFRDRLREDTVGEDAPLKMDLSDDISALCPVLAACIAQTGDKDDVEIRRTALENVGLVLYLMHVIVKVRDARRTNESMEGVLAGQEGLANMGEVIKEAEEISTLIAALTDLGGVILVTVEQDYHSMIAADLVAHFSDPLSSVGQSCAIIINVLLQVGEISFYGDAGIQLMERLVASLPMVADTRVRSRALKCVQTFALRNHTAMIDLLLAQQTDATHVAEISRTLFVEPTLAEKSFPPVIRTLVRSSEAMVEDSNGQLTASKSADTAAFVLTSAMDLRTEDFMAHVSQQLPNILAAAILRLGAVRNDPSATFRAVSLIEACFAVRDSVKSDFDKIHPRFASMSIRDTINDNLADGLTTVIELLVENDDVLLKALFTSLTPHLGSTIVGQRLAAVISVGKMLAYAGEETNHILNALLSRSTDNNNEIRLRVVEGLGNLVFVESATVDSFASPVINALLSSITPDAPEDNILAALGSLSSVVDKVTVQSIAPMLVNIWHQAKALIRRQKPDLKVAVLDMMTMMSSKFGDNEATLDNYTTQCEETVAYWTMMLVDPNPRVMLASRRCMRMSISYWASEDFTALVEERSFDPDAAMDTVDTLARIALIVADSAPALLSTFAEVAASNLRSETPQYREAAAVLLGHVSSFMPGAERDKMGYSSMLLSLLRDPVPSVRESAVRMFALEMRD